MSEPLDLKAIRDHGPLVEAGSWLLARADRRALLARIDAALALADRWTAIHGHDQRAATHHALADDLREVLDPKESQR